jgi:glycosyltransferase involved in cell wall biosynthesis
MDPASRPLVSVVTPVYNGEAHLRACLESVLAQSYTNWDCAVVDNASTDRTPEILREFAARDPRIRVVRNPETVRVIENHNVAFRQISPEARYCKLVAADDRLYPECLEKMVALAEAHPSVAIVGAYALKGTEVAWTGLPVADGVRPGREICREWLLGAPYIFGTPTSVLYRADIVRSRGAFYNESNLHSDSEACLEFLEKSDFGFVHQILTVQGVREDSLTSYSMRYRTYMPFRLYALVRYGPLYLSEEEIRRRIREHLKPYYDHLAAQLFRGREPEFWEYHRRKMAEVGYPLRRARLYAHAAAFALEFLLNPKKTAEGVVRRLRRRSARRPGAY